VTNQRPEVQALIEEAHDLRGMTEGAIQVLVGDLRAALIDALSGETETEWEYGVQYGDTGSFEAFPSQGRAQLVLSATFRDKLVRRTANRVIPAGPWEVVV